MNACQQKPGFPGSLKDPVVFSGIHNICPGFQPAAEGMLQPRTTKYLTSFKYENDQLANIPNTETHLLSFTCSHQTC
jgi:hypothetical protein